MSMANGDYHVEQKQGGWIIEQEGERKSDRKVVEKLANSDQAWKVALYYAQSAGVDAFLHDDHRGIKEEKSFRPSRR
jgi:hypothetical protein